MGLRMRYYSAPDSLGVRSIVMSVSVCLSVCVCLCVCLSTIMSSELHFRSSPIFFIHVTYRSGSVIFWRRNRVMICYVFPVYG